MVFLIVAKMLLLLGLNVETKTRVSDTCFSARKTSTEISLVF